MHTLTPRACLAETRQGAGGGWPNKTHCSGRTGSDRSPVRRERGTGPRRSRPAWRARAPRERRALLTDFRAGGGGRVPQRRGEGARGAGGRGETSDYACVRVAMPWRSDRGVSIAQVVRLLASERARNRRRAGAKLELECAKPRALHSAAIFFFRFRVSARFTFRPKQTQEPNNVRSQLDSIYILQLLKLNNRTTFSLSTISTTTERSLQAVLRRTSDCSSRSPDRGEGRRRRH